MSTFSRQLTRSDYVLEQSLLPLMEIISRAAARGNSKCREAALSWEAVRRRAPPLPVTRPRSRSLGQISLPCRPLGSTCNIRCVDKIHGINLKLTLERTLILSFLKVGWWYVGIMMQALPAQQLKTM